MVAEGRFPRLVGRLQVTVGNERPQPVAGRPFRVGRGTIEWHRHLVDLADDLVAAARQQLAVSRVRPGHVVLGDDPVTGLGLAEPVTDPSVRPTP